MSSKTRDYIKGELFRLNASDMMDDEVHSAVAAEIIALVEQDVARRYGHFNDGCSCCKTTDLYAAFGYDVDEYEALGGNWGEPGIGEEASDE